MTLVDLVNKATSAALMFHNKGYQEFEESSTSKKSGHALFYSYSSSHCSLKPFCFEPLIH